MKRWTLLLALCSCGTTGIDKAESAALHALKGVDVAVTLSTEAVVAAREARMAKCDAERPETRAEARTCLGRLGRDLAPFLEEAAEAYNAAVTAVEQLADVARQLESLKD